MCLFGEERLRLCRSISCSEDENTNIRIILRRIIRLSAFPFALVGWTGWTKMDIRRAPTSTVSGGVGAGRGVLTCSIMGEAVIGYWSECTFFVHDASFRMAGSWIILVLWDTLLRNGLADIIANHTKKCHCRDIAAWSNTINRLLSTQTLLAWRISVLILQGLPLSR